MMRDWTRFFWPCPSRGAAHCNNTLADSTVCMTAKEKSLFMIMWTALCRFCQLCMPNACAVTRPWDTKLPISKSCWRRLIEAFLEVADDTKDFVEGGHFAEEHFAAHFLIVLAPGFKVVSGRQESERTGMERRVVHPCPAEKD